MALKETIKIVLLADTHLGLDLPVKPRVERRRRGWDLLDNYQRVLDYAAREPVDRVTHQFFPVGGKFRARQLELI